ncbi:SPOR domain-containing protein [Treponema sp. TIM-1]|uniref:SPOR domain-containing protein n=1 Tax=Treponema sp. TIM-1 TaxID=2898417 RepID=UPI00397F98D2
MEKRKLLLIAISVGIFLVIVIGASILMFSPKKPIPPAVTGTSRPIPPGNTGEIRSGQTPPVRVDVTDMVKNPDEFKGLQVPPASSTTQENNNHIYINGEPININGEFISGEPSADGTGTRTNLVINIPSPKTPVVPAPAKPVAAPAEPAKPAVSAPRTKPNPPPAAKSTPAAKSVPAAKSAPAAAPRTPAQSASGRTNFWVQTGAFSTQSRAEGVKETLAAKGITSIIENRNVDGKTFYRVRVGPYTSNTEAAYWLTLIKQINGFEDSQIWQNQSRP